MTLDILRRTGGWCVELQQPLKLGPGKEISQIEIRPMTADQTIRWAEERIPSTLALLSELCDVPEKAIRQLPQTEFDRVMMALTSVVSNTVKKSWEAGTRPLATPEEQVSPDEPELFVPAVDQIDPRFPAADGPVVRMGTAPLKPPPRRGADDDDDGGGGSGMDMSMPQTITAVR